MNVYSELPIPAAELVLATNVKHVSIAVDSEAFALLNNTTFQKMWNQLYQSCPWTTAFQSYEFASSWYNINREDYLPIIISSEVDNKLIGILAMALLRDGNKKSTLRNKRNRIVAVGNAEAEYQTWLTNTDYESEFVKKSFSILLHHFPDHDIYFRFIPAGVNISYLTDDPAWKKSCVFQPFKRPLMEINNPEVLKLFKKRGYKLKLNRLKRLGDVKFEHITDLDRFLSFYEQLILQYDFRQGAMFNKKHFKDSLQHKALLIELFKKNLLHTTVLSLNDDIIASIVAVADKNWVHLGGINTHSPFYAAHSPGFVHFLSLGQLLANEQSATVFDLTPGGDAYKERMATSHDIVYELLITTSKSYRIRRRMRKFIHAKLIQAGHRPMSVELALKIKLYLLRARLQGLRRGQWDSKSEPVVLRYAGGQPTVSLPVAVNSLHDLLCHKSGGGRATGWEFLKDAMARFESGQQAYSLTEADQLLCCAWLQAQDDRTQEEAPAAQHQLLELTYCQPAFANRLPAFFVSAIAHYQPSEAHTLLQIKADIKDRQLIKVLSIAGFQ